MTLVVGLTGYAQHGKDSVGARLVEKHGFTRFAFADLLKSMALVLDPLIPDEGVRVVANPGPRGYVAQRLSFLVSTYGWEVAKGNPEVRRFLQVLGTEAVREHLGTDTWVDATFGAIRKSGAERAVITDARFPNEFAAVKRHGYLVRVTRYETNSDLFDNGIGKDHPSEQYVEQAPADMDITATSGDMEGLMARADAMVEELLFQESVR